MNSCASPLERIGPSAMTLSVVIATRDRPRELHGTVFSLLGQTRAANELIVIDQSIESGGRRAVERAVAARSRDHGTAPMLRYIHDPSIRGAAPARNVGIDLAGGDIVVFLDDDVILEPDFLLEIAAVYAQDPTVTGVSGIITNYERPPVWQRALLRVFWRGPFHDQRQPIYWNADGLRGAPPLNVDRFGTTGMSLRRRALGPLRFDPRLRDAWPGEDVDLCCRLGSDRKLVIATEARFAHMRVPTNRPREHWIKRDVQAMYYLYRRHWDRGPKNRVRFGWLNLGYVLLATLGGLRRRTLEPWRMFLEARREARAYREPLRVEHAADLERRLTER